MNQVNKINPPWSKEPPDMAGWYWWHDGEPDHIPVAIYVYLDDFERIKIIEYARIITGCDTAAECSGSWLELDIPKLPHEVAL